MTNEFARYLVPVLVMVFVVVRMMRRTQGRPLKPSRLWIRPGILVVFLGLAFLHPPALTVATLGIFAASAVLGVLLGYLMSRHQELSVDQATGTLISRMSPIGIAIFVLLLAGRFALRMVMQGGQAPDRLMAHSDQVLMWTDAGLIFAVTLLTAQAWEIWRRAKRLLDDHAAAKAANPQP